MVNALVGTWVGKEFYTAYTNDSVTLTNTKDITLVLNANSSGTYTSYSDVSPIGWSNPPGKFSMVTKIASTTTIAAIGYYFDIKDSTATTQKWYTETYYSNVGGKKLRYTYDWQLTKK